MTLICGAVHFVAALLFGVLAQGLDFDQLRSRSAVSRLASPVQDFLMGPHGAVIRAMPNEWLTQGVFPIIPVWLAMHSLLWGLVAAIIIVKVGGRRTRTPSRGS